MRSSRFTAVFIVLLGFLLLLSSSPAQIAKATQSLPSQRVNPRLPIELRPPGFWPVPSSSFFLRRLGLKRTGDMDLSSIFEESATYSSGGSDASSITVAEVNDDGKLDVIVLNFCETGNSGDCPDAGVVGVLLGNGDGTLQAAQPYSSGGYSAIQLAVMDLNGDGKSDIVALNQCEKNDGLCLNGSIGVLLGNGDGTFQAAQTYSLGRYNPSSIVLGDINGDGKPDLLVAYYCQDMMDCGHGEIDALLGNGDGTFHAPRSFNSGGYLPEAISLADVNRDGRQDLVLANCGGTDCVNGTASVLLGNGDGTFQPAQTYFSGADLALAIAAADANGDGIPDLLVANYCISPGGACGNGGILSVLLGNGDGTFQPAQTYISAPQGCSNAGYCPISIAVADVNGDKKPDVLMGSAVLLGNGDGTFQPAQNFNSGTCGTGEFAIADLNGDGRPDVVLANYYGTTICNNVGLTVFLNSVDWPTSTSLVSSLNPSIFGQTITFTARVKPLQSYTPTGTITFRDGETVLGTLTLTRRHAILSTSTLSSGIHSITASYSGDNHYQPNVSAAFGQVVYPAITTTTVVSSANPVPLNVPVTYVASVSSQFGGSVTGTVTFKDRDKTIAIVGLAGNRALHTFSYSAFGAHSITALYSGDASNSGSTSYILKECAGKECLGPPEKESILSIETILVGRARKSRGDRL